MARSQRQSPTSDAAFDGRQDRRSSSSTSSVNHPLELYPAVNTHAQRSIHQPAYSPDTSAVVVSGGRANVDQPQLTSDELSLDLVNFLGSSTNQSCPSPNHHPFTDLPEQDNRTASSRPGSQAHLQQGVVNDKQEQEHPSQPVNQTSSVKALPGQERVFNLPNLIPSFSAFRRQASTIPLPLSSLNTRIASRSPKSASISLPQRPSPKFADPAARPLSVDSPLRTHPPTPFLGTFSTPVDDPSVPSIHFPQPPSKWAFHETADSIDSRLAGLDPTSTSSPHSNGKSPRRSSFPSSDRDLTAQRYSHASMNSISSMDSFSVYSNQEQTHHAKPVKAPDLKLQFDGVQRSLSNGSQSSDASANSLDPKSAAPVSKFGSFFGWKSNGRAESPTTTFSERSATSPLPSPHLEKALPKSPSGQKLSAPFLDAGHATSSSDFAPKSLLGGSVQTNAHVKELEQELEHISSELASSIRREMELEDELDRMRADMPNQTLSEQNRRGSDYFSDSGASSTRYPISNVDERIEQLEGKVRKVEQDRALIKNDMASRVRIELARRKELEEMYQQLEFQFEKRPQQDGPNPDGSNSKVQELELTLEEVRRRLSKERTEKDSFEELYSATKLELARYRNERDNLRDEIVPGLRARVEGLEAQAAETEALVYENTRMQQELAALRSGSETPRMAQSRFAIAEEGGLRNLSRSNSMAKRGGSMARSGSIKGEGRARSGSIDKPVTAEGFKEIEDQRDALHKALKLLINRHEKQQKDHRRALDKMSRARDVADKFINPRRSGYYKEVAFLKEEVTTLRKRTEDALEQKWEYEKGLGGLKMDLDRAEQETRGLRNLLHQHDIIPRSTSISDGDESEDQTDMELSISKLEKERDAMRRMAQDYRAQAASGSGGSAQALVDAAARIEDLAAQLDGEVKLNKELRERLASAVAKGEKEQKDSTRQIETMQRRLFELEESVLAAQQHSEKTLVNHESESRRIEEATSPQLQRLEVILPEPGKLSPTSPLRTPKSPRARRLSEVSLLEAGRTQMLERKVRELENSLREAEEDMQTVVQRVNRSQVEVAELQTERDAALTQMRKLQKTIHAEKEKASKLMT